MRQAYPLSQGPDRVEAKRHRWGVVQPVGHHTVNVDGEGSNPSAPANSPLQERIMGTITSGIFSDGPACIISRPISCFQPETKYQLGEGKVMARKVEATLLPGGELEPI